MFDDEGLRDFNPSEDDSDLFKAFMHGDTDLTSAQDLARITSYIRDLEDKASENEAAIKQSLTDEFIEKLSGMMDPDDANANDGVYELSSTTKAQLADKDFRSRMSKFDEGLRAEWEDIEAEAVINNYNSFVLNDLIDFFSELTGGTKDDFYAICLKHSYESRDKGLNFAIYQYYPEFYKRVIVNDNLRNLYNSFVEGIMKTNDFLEIKGQIGISNIKNNLKERMHSFYKNIFGNYYDSVEAKAVEFKTYNLIQVDSMVRELSKNRFNTLLELAFYENKIARRYPAEMRKDALITVYEQFTELYANLIIDKKMKRIHEYARKIAREKLANYTTSHRKTKRAIWNAPKPTLT